MNVTFITLGCKVNQYETEAMLSILTQNGFALCPQGKPADVVVINSCTVTSASDQKVRQMLHKTRKNNPDAVIVLTGCMPQAFPAESAELTEADVVLGNSNRSALLPAILEYVSTKQRIIQITPHSENSDFESLAIETFHEHTRAFIKIQDGCNRFCSYCIIPYARGRVRSKQLTDLTKEVTTLAKNGYQEIILTGINLSAYGQELDLHLCDAVEAVSKVDGIKRIRLGSLEPERLTTDVIARLAQNTKLCPQFHLSLQSGSDTTLRRMNRHYTTSEYRQIVENLHSAFQNAAITTDIMVGYPGETEAEFKESLAFAAEIGFAKVHVFAYSKRPGTKAFTEENQIDSKTKTQRSKEMIKATNQSRTHFLKSQIGSLPFVLFEREIEENVFEGYSENYTPIRVQSKGNLCGEICEIYIEKADENNCFGRVPTSNIV